MHTCKVCTSQITSWENWNNSGLCPKCWKENDRKKRAVEWQKQLEDARIKLRQIAAQMVADDEIDIFGLAIWDTVGSRISGKFHQWVSMVLLGGVLGSVLHSRTHILGLVALSRKGTLCTGEIGEIPDERSVDSTSIVNSSLTFLRKRSVTKTPIGEDMTISSTGDTLVVALTGNKELRATFPRRFNRIVEANGEFPSKIVSILSARVQGGGQAQPSK